MWDDEIDARAAQRAAELRTRLRLAVFDAEDPSPDELFEHVFTKPTPDLVAQRDALAAELTEER
jgi:pyruvate dehydrogenase E1 component alpha subunit